MSEPDNGVPVLSLIQQIQSGQVAPKTLDRSTRQQCVEVLTGEGYTHHAIAQILQCSDRTIRRDLVEIRDRNALVPSHGLVVQLVGQLVTSADRHESLLTRLARDSTASVSERVQADYLAWKVRSELVQRLQGLGYLPTAPTTVVSEVTLHGDVQVGVTFEGLRAELVRLEELAAQSGTDTPEARAERQAVLAEVEQYRLSERVARLEHQPQKDTSGAE